MGAEECTMCFEKNATICHADILRTSYGLLRRSSDVVSFSLCQSDRWCRTKKEPHKGGSLYLRKCQLLHFAFLDSSLSSS